MYMTSKLKYFMTTLRASTALDAREENEGMQSEVLETPQQSVHSWASSSKSHTACNFFLVFWGRRVPLCNNHFWHDKHLFFLNLIMLYKYDLICQKLNTKNSEFHSLLTKSWDLLVNFCKLFHQKKRDEI